MSLKQSAISVIVLVFCLILITNSNSILSRSLINEQEKVVESEFPVRLKIPKLEINAVIEHLSLTPEGAMDVPKGPLDVSWFNLGPRPGEVGSAVIAGHRSWKNGQRAVFDNLDKIGKGDYLYIETADGQLITFIVREIRVYHSYDYVPEIFASDDGIAHLNLITCIGAWNASLRESAERLVVFADILD